MTPSLDPLICNDFTILTAPQARHFLLVVAPLPFLVHILVTDKNTSAAEDKGESWSLGIPKATRSGK